MQPSVELPRAAGEDGFDLPKTWVGVQGYCVRSGEEVEGWRYAYAPPSGYRREMGEWVCRSPAAIYLGALYTCTSVSAIIASPGNSSEQLTAVLLMLAGGTVWAQVRTLTTP